LASFGSELKHQSGFHETASASSCRGTHFPPVVRRYLSIRPGRAATRLVDVGRARRRELQIRNRAKRQEPDWHKRYAVRSGMEGTICEFVHGHDMRRCRYRGQAKAHLQHVLTAIAVNVERLSRQPSGESPPPRAPTAFQKHCDQQGVRRLTSWRGQLTLGSDQDPRQSQVKEVVFRHPSTTPFANSDTPLCQFLRHLKCRRIPPLTD
jgi:hypothetical protein